MDRCLSLPAIPPRSAAWGLAALSFTQFMIALDYSIVYVAMPALGHQLRLAANEAQWVMSAYALLFAGFLLLGGRLSDRYGPVRVFVCSSGLFGAASLLGGIAVSAAPLLAARGLQGLAAAALQPSLIALISLNFAEGAPRTRALAIWGAVGASGLVAGVALGGLLAAVSWRLVFFINLPIALLCMAGARRWLDDQSARRTAQALPWLAALLGTAAMSSLALVLTLLGERTARAEHVGYALLATAILLPAFLLAEWKSPQPMIPRETRRLPSLRAGCFASACYMAGVGTEFFLVTLLLQEGYGYGPLQAGLLFLPLAATIIAGNMAAGRWIPKVGAAQMLFWGFLLAQIGLWLIAICAKEYDYLSRLLPGLLISGLAHGMIYTAKFAVGIRGIPEKQHGAASALMVTAQYASGAVALALLSLVLQRWTGHAGYQAGFALLGLFSLMGALHALHLKLKK